MIRRQIIPYNSKLKNRVRRLRKNMTEAEVRLRVHFWKKQVANLQSRQGLKVIRVSNLDVLRNIEGVVSEIVECIA